MMICAFCGGDHSWFYCRTKPEGWKPPKKSTGERRRGDGRLTAPSGVKAEVPQKLAAPVDTHLGRPRMEGPSQGKSKRAAEMRDYMRKRRAAQKEGL